MPQNMQAELDKVAAALISGSLTDKQYCELYAVQQALAWATDPESAAPPFQVVMEGKVQAPIV